MQGNYRLFVFSSPDYKNAHRAVIYRLGIHSAPVCTLFFFTQTIFPPVLRGQI
jgi:hypothetical protein